MPPCPDPISSLSPEEIALLDALATAEKLYEPRAAIEAKGHDPATIDALIARGWLTAWGFDDATFLVLTPAALARLRLEVVETGPAESPRYGRQSPPRRAKEREAWLQQPPSPLPGWGDLPAAYPFVVVQKHPCEVPWPEGFDAVATSKEPSPHDAVVMAEERDEEGRAVLDPETGKPVVSPLALLGQKVIPVDYRMARGDKARVARKKPKPKGGPRKPGLPKAERGGKTRAEAIAARWRGKNVA